MPRYLMFANLIEGRADSYIEEHDNIYPEVSVGLKKAGVKDLHIWRKGESNEIFMYIEMEEVSLPFAGAVLINWQQIWVRGV